MIRKIFIETEWGLVARVTFILPDSTWADTIYLVGDFNEWNHTSHPFQRDREGTWTLTLNLEAGRCYQFRYLLDGQWISDIQADGFVGNPHGSNNSLVVTDPKFKRYPDEQNERRGGQKPSLEIDDPQVGRVIVAHAFDAIRKEYNDQFCFHNMAYIDLGQLLEGRHCMLQKVAESREKKWICLGRSCRESSGWNYDPLSLCHVSIVLEDAWQVNAPSDFRPKKSRTYLRSC